MTARRSIHSMVALLAMVGSACSSSSSPSSASGGIHSNGGASGQGGTTGVGGIPQPGTGGANATGGRTAAGGAGAGGQSGSGGANATGGRTAAGGAGTGGQSGSGGAATGGTGTVATGGAGGSSSTGGSASGGTSSGTGMGGATAAGGTQSHDGGPGTGGTGGGPAIDAGGGSGAAVPSAGCGKTPTLKNSPSNTTFTQNALTINGKARQFIMRWPDDYKNGQPYRLIFGLHGATGKGADVAGPTSKEGPYFGLWDLSKGSTIFIAPSADGGLWDATSDTAFVSAILKAVEDDLCIDTSRIMLEGFSQGAAMSWTLACGLEGVFRAAVGHSGGGVANPSKCQPIAYFGSGGTKENVTQTSQSDQFAKWDGCTIETFAAAPSGGHSCNDYKNCSAGHPVRWCPFDDSHMPDPADSGKSTSWMPSEVWPFMSQF